MGSLSIWHWLIVLLVVVLIFGTKKLRNLGSDVGGAVKEFKDAMNQEGNTDSAASKVAATSQSKALEAQTAEVAPVKSTARKRAPAAKKAPAKTAAKKAPAAKTAAAKPKTTKKATASKAKKAEA